MLYEKSKMNIQPNPFDTFNELVGQISISSSQPHLALNATSKCKHGDISVYHYVKTCMECGKEFTNEVSFDKEWLYNNNSVDPTRCQIRKCDTKSISKDIKNMGFTDKIIDTANEMYKEVTNGKIFRGNSRKAIIFACIFNAYKINGTPRSCEELIKMFGLDKKIGLRGIKYIHLNMSNDSKLREIRITPHHIISEMMKKFDTTHEQIHHIQQIYDDVKNKSSIINRSRPTSIAAGIIYYYIIKMGRSISIKDFSKEVGLSDLTIKKIVKEVERIYPLSTNK